MAEKSLAVITARGGSKRVPRKNIKEFCGEPIIAYSIRAALKSGIFDEVMVSTDDEEIAKIAKELGAQVPFLRSPENSGDMAMTHEVVLEVLRGYQQLGREFDIVCCIYPTAPFLTAERLKESMEKLRQEKADGVMPVVRFSFPPQRCFVIADGLVAYKWPENRLKRSQDLEPYYHDCGQFYLLRVEPFLREQSMVLANTVPVIMDEKEVQDIDTPEDWEMAEMKFRLLRKGKD
jgi:N-acylneuraminate cytidylyltransferase